MKHLLCLCQVGIKPRPGSVSETRVPSPWTSDPALRLSLLTVNGVHLQDELDKHADNLIVMQTSYHMFILRQWDPKNNPLR